MTNLLNNIFIEYQIKNVKILFNKFINVQIVYFKEISIDNFFHWIETKS